MSEPTVEQFLDGQPPEAQAWLREFHAYMGRYYPQVQPILFRGVPMFRFFDSYLKGYVMFTPSKAGGAAHAIDFDLVDAAKAAVGGSQPNKGCVKVEYADEDAKAVVRELIDAVMARHGFAKQS